MMWALNLYVFVIIAISFALCSENAVICYYGTWATYRHGNGKFEVENIDPQLCTHLIYSFAGINNQGEIIALDPYLDLADNWGRDNFRKFNALKQKNPSLKTLLAIGGWNEGSAKYSRMVASTTLKKNFVDSAVKILVTYGFDGLDLDWEYPNRRDTVYGQADIDNFTNLLRDLRQAFDQYGFMLSAAVSSVKEMASLSYDIPAISQYLDTINLMTYDMAGSWDATTGHNAPLFAGEGYEDNSKAENSYTVAEALNYWINAGCPPEKLAIGVPFYARTFWLATSSSNGVRAPSSGAGLGGPFTATPGSLGYNELCYIYGTESWAKRYDSLAKVPYAFKDSNWVSYDDAESLAVKIDYAKTLGINKVMIWSIESDDFNGLCGNGANPLLRAVNIALNGNSGDTDTTTQEPSTSTANINTSIPTTTVTSTSNGLGTSTPSGTSTTESTQEQENICVQEGFASNPQNCSSFYMCVRDSSGALKPNEFQCPSNLYWDQLSQVCNYRQLVNCEE